MLMLDTLLIKAISSPFLTGGASTILGLLVIIVFVYIITAIIGKPLNIGLGPLKLYFSGGHRGQKQKPTSQSDKLILSERIKSIVSEHQREIVDLSYDTLKRQINYAEEKVGDIKSIMAETYSGLLRNKLPKHEKNKVKSHSEYKTYQMMLRIAMNECVITLLKKSFKTNHLDEMDSKEWQKYVQHKTDIALTRVSEFLDIMYGEHFLINRQELSDGNDLHVIDFKNEIQDILETAKEINQKNKTKIELQKEKMNTKIGKIIQRTEK